MSTTTCRSKQRSPPAPAVSRSKRRVGVAMSGGVDSSATAAMLAREGHEIFGVTLRLFDYGGKTPAGSCCAGRDARDARRVANHLGIPHYVLDFEQKFQEAVVDDFADSYLAGETPLPCVRCNQRVKFRDLLETAIQLGADTLATGHYARRGESSDGDISLHRAADRNKDQTYFLFATTREQLTHLRFPLGDLESKSETRRIAADAGLPVADKPESQDLCFVASSGYRDLMTRLRPGERRGTIVDEAGVTLGEHDGIDRFTVGQRRGLGLSGKDPLYVLRIDSDTRTVVVGPESQLYHREVAIKDVNWIGGKTVDEAPSEGWPVLARIRSRGGLHRAKLIPLEDDAARVCFEQPVRAPSPGQACVAYDTEGSRVLGGGWIYSPLVSGGSAGSQSAVC